MKTKKLVAVLLASMSLSVVGMTACNGGGNQQGNNTVVVSDKVCNVQLFKGGYGVDWIYELKSNFERVYAEEGYKINVLQPSYDMKGSTAQQMMYMGYEENGVDLYIVGDLFPNGVGANGNYGVIAEDIEKTVYELPAINFSGEEEGQPISAKLSPDVVPYTKDENGVMYGFNWTQSISGLVVNTKKLSAYGLEKPKTTNELFDCFDKIYRGHNGQGNSGETKVYPIVYVSGSNGYTTSYLETVLAQYGMEEYQSFWNMLDEEGEYRLEDGYEVFAEDNILEMLNIAYRTFDVTIACPGTLQMTVDKAQAAIMKSGNKANAVFMFNGDWMLNEVKLNYPNNLNDIEFINCPVNSAVGKKLFGKGTIHNMSDADCEALLTYMIDLVDQNKSLEEIVTAVKTDKGITITVEEAEQVANARGVYTSRGVEHMAYIAKNAGGKKVAELVLRMMASNDFAEIYSNHANGTTPYASSINNTASYKFVKQASEVAVNQHVRIVAGRTSGLRGKLPLGNMLSTQAHVPYYISTLPTNTSPTIYTLDYKLNGKDIQVYRDAAAALQQRDYENVKKNWNTYLTNAGLNK